MAKAAADPRVKAVLIQRSKGYSTRASLSVAEIGEARVEYPLDRWISTAFTRGSAAARASPSRCV